MKVNVCLSDSPIYTFMIIIIILTPYSINKNIVNNIIVVAGKLL